MKLELKHLAAYLPYDIKIFCGKLENTNLIYPVLGVRCFVGDIRVTTFTDGENAESGFAVMDLEQDNARLLLRPLSDLTKEIEVNGEKFLPILELLQYAETDYEREFIDNIEEIIKSGKIKYMPYSLLQLLLEWHFDIFGLRENNLCIYYDEL